MSAEHGHHGGPQNVRVVESLTEAIEPIGDVVEHVVSVLFLGLLNAPGRRATGHGDHGHH